jgi:hypothetical protein
MVSTGAGQGDCKEVKPFGREGMGRKTPVKQRGGGNTNI